MGVTVRNLYLVKGRWKYRKVIPPRLRPFIEGSITEYVRWLGPGGQQPSPEVLRKYAEVDAECNRLIELADKRASGRFDELSAEAVANIIATARTELLEEDEEERFDTDEDDLRESVAKQLSDVGIPTTSNTAPHQRWTRRQEAIESALAQWRQDYALGQISEFVTSEVIDRCAAKGLNVDPQSRGFRRLAKAYLALLIEAGEACLMRQHGVAVPTPPTPSQPEPPQLGTIPQQTITGLVEDWWREAKAAGRSISTYEAYERVARQLTSFLGHDDANRVTKADIISFKDHRLSQGVSPKTVKDSDLAGLRSLFGWALANARVTENPVEGVTTITPRKARERPKGFTDEEARAILMHASRHRPQGKEHPKTTAAKRWIPWLLAYSGARVGEMVQLRKKDLRREGNIWVLSLSPEAVTIKGGKYREVPLHPHLVESGFPTFVQASPDEFLFIQPRDGTDAATRAAWRTIKNRLTQFVREVVTDERVQPNHAWRHRLETISRDLNIRRDVTDAITGHTTPGVAATYGDVTLEAKAAAISQLPRYPVPPPPV